MEASAITSTYVAASLSESGATTARDGGGAPQATASGYLRVPQQRPERNVGLGLLLGEAVRLQRHVVINKRRAWQQCEAEHNERCCKATEREQAAAKRRADLRSRGSRCREAERLAVWRVQI